MNGWMDGLQAGSFKRPIFGDMLKEVFTIICFNEFLSKKEVLAIFSEIRNAFTPSRVKKKKKAFILTAKHIV